MLGSSAIQRLSHQYRGLAVLPLVVGYLALSVLATRAGLDALTDVLEPSEQTSSDAPPQPHSALSLGGDDLP
jgi:hypothetical protein